MFLPACLILFSTYQVLAKEGYQVLAKEGYPPMWDDVSENIEHFHKHNTTVVINPWNYLERMGMYKILLNVTAEFLDLNKPDNKRNMLWGLPLQLGWQLSTGRLSVPSTVWNCGQNNKTQTCISDRSWWACINYYLSVIPFLGAYDAGLFTKISDIEISKPTEFTSDFCYNVSHCHLVFPELMETWKSFFEFIKMPRLINETLLDYDEFLFRMWKAHTMSNSISIPMCEKRLNYISAPESKFAKDWVLGVEFIAATKFITDFENTNEYQVFLPHRMLIEGNNNTDFSKEEIRVLSTLQWINKINSFT
ncbi:hypothetical protein GDO86_009438, partial [Hymenochirus boettgeri]